GTTRLAALRSDEVDLAGTGGSTFVLGYLEGLETLVIGANVKILDSNVLVRPEIQTVDDLRGKTIGVNRLKASTDVAARLAFQRLGLQPDVVVSTRGAGGQAVRHRPRFRPPGPRQVQPGRRPRGARRERGLLSAAVRARLLPGSRGDAGGARRGGAPRGAHDPPRRRSRRALRRAPAQ